MDPMAKDEKPIPPAKTQSDNKPPETHAVLPSLVLDNEEEAKAKQQTLSRNKGAETNRRKAQFAPEAQAMIDRHSHVKPSTLAMWLQSKPETKSLPGVTLPNGEPMEHDSLAKKIGRYRRQHQK
jgi:hypothetical protein